MPILRGNITETVDITENGTHDVARFTSANVNVQGGAVDSVNGKTGDVILTAEDLAAIHSYESEEDVPQASADNLNQVIFFAGEQESQLEGHRFYQCVKYIRSLLLNNPVEVISFNGTPSTEPSITLSSYAIYNTISNNDGDDLNSDTIMLYINPVYDDNTGEQIVDYNIDLCYNKWYESMVAVQVGGGTISDLQTALFSLFGLTVDLSGYEEVWSFELKLPCEYGYNWSLLAVDNSLTWNTNINKWKTYPQGSVYWVTNGFGGVEYIANFTFNSKSLFIGCEGSGKPYFLSNDIDTSELRVTVWYDPQGSYGTIFKVEFKEQSSALIVEGNYLATYNESTAELGLYTNEEMADVAARFIQALPNSGGDSLPSQAGNSGKFLTTDGTDASWSDKPLINKATGTNSVCTDIATTYIRSTQFGSNAVINGNFTTGVGYDTRAGNGGTAVGAEAYATSGKNVGFGTAIGRAANANGNASIALGAWATANGAHSIQIGGAGGISNYDDNTMNVCLGELVTQNYKLLLSDGTIPTDRFTTTPSADGTYVPTLTISSGTVTRSWETPSSGSSTTATTGTLTIANWSSNTQTINVTGVTASNNVIISPAPASQAAYTAAGVLCTAQGAGILTFTCTSTPASDLTVNVLIM